jgi:hypothetical protein
VRLDAARAVEWVRSACRFAPVVLTVDGEQVWEHIPGGLFRARIGHPLPGQLWIAAGGSAPCLWLLQHGVLSTRASVPGYPPFHAVLEMGQLVPQPSTSAALREAVTPYLGEVIDQAAAMLVRIGRGIPGLDEAPRMRVTELLLRCARRGLRREQISALPIVQAFEPDSRQPSWLSVAELAQRLRAARQGVFAVSPDRKRSAYAVGGATVAVTTTEERGLLEDLIGRDLEQPPALRREALLARLQRVVVTVVRRVLGGPWKALAGARRGRAVDAEDLTRPERHLVEALTHHTAVVAGPAPRAVIREGEGAVRRGFGSSWQLDLPRRSPLVAASARLLEQDPSWTYPVLLALLDGRAEPSPELRSRWLRQILRAPQNQASTGRRR